MDYLSNMGNQRKKLSSGANSSVQGELVTPAPTNYTKPKALPNETFIDGQKASTAVGRPNPQIGQTQQALPKPSALNGELFTQSPANFKPTPAIQNPAIDGQVSRPLATVNNQIKTTPLNIGSSSAINGELVTSTPTAFKPSPMGQGSIIDGQVSRQPLAGTQSLTQAVQKPPMPPYQPTANPVNQYGGMPPNGNAGNVGNVGASSPPPPAQSITSRLAGGMSRLSAAMPAIQAGMNASNMMNQEANFAKNIHAGSIADPNFGNELMGTAPKKSFSRTSTPASNPTTENAAIGRGGIPVVPEQYINSRAGKIENPAYRQYMASHPQQAATPAKAAVPPANQAAVNQATAPQQAVNHTPPNYSLSDPKKALATHAEILLNGQTPTQPDNRPKMPTSMNDVTSGTGYIKGGNGAFKNGMGFIQNENGMMGSDGKQRTPQRGLSMPTSDNRMDINVLDRLEAQRASGAITAAQAGKIYTQYQEQAQADAIQKLPLEQRAQAAMQLSAGRGNVQAAQELTNQQQIEGQNAVQNRQLANTEKTTDHTINNPVQQLAEHKAVLEMMAASKDPAEAEQGKQGLAQLAALTPTPLEKLKTKQFDPTTGLPLAEQEEFGNPLTGQIYSRGEKRSVGGAPPEGTEGVLDGKRVRVVRGQPVPI